jgi:Lipase maturation factor
MFDLPGYWYSRYLFERGLALMYVVAFLSTANQVVPLLGENGLLPISRFIRFVPFRSAPSLFYLTSSDAALRVAAWAGVGLAVLVLIGYPQRWGTLAAAVVWTLLWMLYLSFVNVGQTFYGFIWETLLLETGFIAIFAGGAATTPNALVIWMWRWILVRVMLGAGLIKLRGDPCWRDLTCLQYHFETQPIPNTLSWYFHWLPEVVHRAGVVFNHVAEIGVPFLYFLPQPFAAIGGLITIVFELVLIVSGNFAWLNWLTIVLCIPTLDDRWLKWIPVTAPSLEMPTLAYRALVGGVALVVAVLSIFPIRNMLSSQQVMNRSFNPLHVVNTYGLFGSITRPRYEVVIEGTSDAVVTDKTAWRAYEFKAKPGDPSRLPPQIAPYHLRLDWMMWFAALGTPTQHPWFTSLLVKLLQGDRAVLGLMGANPFPDAPPRWVRARFYEYRFTTPEERRMTGRWWNRQLVGDYMPPVGLQGER